MRMIRRWLLVAAPVALLVAGCAPTAAPSGVVAATTFFRQSSASHYHGKTATNDHRGCAKVTAKWFICTAYVRNPRNPDRNFDVYGTITVNHIGMLVKANLAHGQQIQNWFADTQGGCETASCKGTVYRSG